MNIDCAQAISLLNWFHDGELNAAQRDLVSQHVSHCRDCAAELEAIGILDRAARQLTQSEPPAELWNRIAGRLDSPRPGKFRLVQRRFFVRAAIVVAVAVLGAMLVDGLRSRMVPKVAPSVIGPYRPRQFKMISGNFDMLDPVDNRLAHEQFFCGAGICNEPLGFNGQPVKILLDGRPVFVCCPECERWARAHPAETLAKLDNQQKRK